MGKYVKYPKWKYAKGASPIEATRSVMVANKAQEDELDGEWYDRPDFTNNTHEETQQAVDSAIPAGYEPKAYPKWLYCDEIAGGRMVYNQGEEDKLHDDYPYDWRDAPNKRDSEVQLKAFGAPENTGLDPNDPLVASDPVRLQQQTERRDAVILHPVENVITADDMDAHGNAEDDEQQGGEGGEDDGTDDSKSDTANTTAEEVKAKAENTVTAKKAAVAVKSAKAVKEGADKARKPVEPKKTTPADTDLL